MSTANQVLPTAPLTTEQKIELAALEAGQVAGIFIPGINAAVRNGVAVEPVVSGFVHLLIGIFKHHVATPSPAPAPVAAKSNAGESLAAAIARAQARK